MHETPCIGSISGLFSPSGPFAYVALWGRQPLAVKIPGDELVLAQKEGADNTVIDFIGEIQNEYGTVISNIRDKVEIKLKGEAATRLATSPVQYDAGFTLLPGNYIIKFLARNAESGRIGTYLAEFVVPNLNKELVRLPISSVVLSGQRVAMTDALANTGKNKEARAQIANPLIENGLKVIPGVTRVFRKTASCTSTCRPTNGKLRSRNPWPLSATHDVQQRPARSELPASNLRRSYTGAGGIER